MIINTFLLSYQGSTHRFVPDGVTFFLHGRTNTHRAVRGFLVVLVVFNQLFSFQLSDDINKESYDSNQHCYGCCVHIASKHILSQFFNRRGAREYCNWGALKNIPLGLVEAASRELLWPSGFRLIKTCNLKCFSSSKISFMGFEFLTRLLNR